MVLSTDFRENRSRKVSESVKLWQFYLMGISICFVHRIKAFQSKDFCDFCSWHGYDLYNTMELRAEHKAYMSNSTLTISANIVVVRNLFCFCEEFIT
jgi:hypothetical protein